MAEKKPPTKEERKILDFIGQFESNGGDYDIVYSGYKDELEKPLTDMTVKEVLALQNKMKSSGSSAVGAHQFINSTLLEEIKKQKISKDTLFTSDLQDELIIGRLKRVRGLDKWMSGSLDTEAFAKNLSKEFASLPNPETGKSYYDKKAGNNKSLTNTADVLGTLNKIKFPDEENPEILATGSSVDPEVILSNPDIDDGTKEELLKLNDGAGLQPDTIAQLQPKPEAGPSLMSQLTNSSVEAPTNEGIINDDIVNSEVNMRDDRRNLGHTGDISAFPADFKLLNTSFKDGGLVNSFNTGGSHEDSPHGGIPIGQNQSGGDNLVEEGETKYGDYVFPKEVILDKKTAERFHWDKSDIGKPLSDISEKLNARIDERPFDSIEVGTVKRALDKLILVNESLRPSETSSTEFPSGNDQAFELGGAARGQFNTLGSQGSNTVVAGEQDQNQFVDGAKDTAAGILGPWGMAFRAIQKLGVAGGDAIGGNAGAGIADVFSPEESNISAFTTNSDRTMMEKFSLQTPFIGGMQNNKFKNERENAIRTDRTAAANNFHRESDFGSARTFFGEGNTQTSGGDVVAKFGGNMKSKKKKKDNIPEVRRRRLDDRLTQGTGENITMAPGEQGMAKPERGPSMEHLRQLLAKIGSNGGIEATQSTKDLIKEREKYKEHNRGVNDRAARKNKNFAGGGYAGMGITAAVGLAGSIMENQKRQKELENFNEIYAEQGNMGQRQSDFKHGGDTKMNDGGFGRFKRFGLDDEEGIEYTRSDMSGLQVGGNPSQFFQQEQRRDASKYDNLGERTGAGQFFDGAAKAAGNIGKGLQNTNYINSAMRALPAARNLFKRKERADGTKFGRLRDRYIKQKRDKTTLDNKISNATGNARRAILESSMGSGAQASKNIQQLHINELKARSDASFQEQAFDANQNQIAQAFNKDTNVKNQSTGMQEVAANEANQAATRLKNETMRNAGVEDIGLIARENKMAGILKTTTGYTPDGEKDKGQGFLSKLYSDFTASSRASEEQEKAWKKKYGYI